ncbi:VanW family protein [Fredinandcohnia sp. QZ13]|uniref:VanW family protein n=1 Tax=Fredinandcohnia sp. QZ13 TaxID=3073144 RepID=UPI002852F655|nr:VanW family protein [Fredinandcohnia sp. QZ13]MDR4887291.1 VanW family protein [Fredinandcohnia sp. QZ13]
MKKTTLPLLLGVLLMSGCSLIEKKEPVSVVLHHVSPVETIETKQVINTHEISIIDPRDNSVVEVLNKGEYQTEEELKAKAEQLASDLAATIDRPMKPVKLSAGGELQGGQSQMILKEAELVTRILDNSIFNKQVVLPIEETNPNVTQDQVQGINEVVLGSFTTYFNPSVTGRNFNIKKSADEVNDVVLGPGDRFSFNYVVGNGSKENGYALATVIINKEFVPGYGGGICQTSSTLYNAVAKSGLEIIELHHHSKPVGYVPLGHDATVAYPYLDFKFANNRPYPVVLKTTVNASSITVEVRSAANYVSN